MPQASNGLAGRAERWERAGAHGSGWRACRKTARLIPRSSPRAWRLRLVSGTCAHPESDPVAEAVSSCEDTQMRSVFVIASLITLAGSAPSEKSGQEALMDEIESSIRLPPEARPLESYARYYTEYEGSVHGAYTTKIEAPRPADYGCEEFQLNGRSKAVPCPALADARHGERRWVKFDDYPAVAGENCSAIQLAFDLRTRKITYLQCAEPLH